MAGHSPLTTKLIKDGLKRRTDDRGPLRLMAKAEGYVMVRRPGCVPFVLQESDWLALPATEKAA